jgi:hypothetical protein
MLALSSYMLVNKIIIGILYAVSFLYCRRFAVYTSRPQGFGLVAQYNPRTSLLRSTHSF